MTDETAPQFEVVPRAEAQKITPPRRPRRSWAPVMEALLDRRHLFMRDDELSDRDVKYLQLALHRRGKGEHLRTTVAQRQGVSGRMIWIER